MIVTRLRYNFIGSACTLYDFCDLIAPPQQPSPCNVAFVESKRRHLADVKRFGGDRSGRYGQRARGLLGKWLMTMSDTFGGGPPRIDRADRATAFEPGAKVARTRA